MAVTCKSERKVVPHDSKSDLPLGSWHIFSPVLSPCNVDGNWKSWVCGKKAKMMMFLLTASRLAELIMQRGDFKKTRAARHWFSTF